MGSLGASVRALATLMSIDEASAYQVELAVVEAATNSIRHALSEEPESWVALEAELSDAQLLFTLRNRGRALDPKLLEKAKVPAVDAGTDLAAFPEGGMGLGLVKEVMSEVSVRQVDGINEFRMVFIPN